MTHLGYASTPCTHRREELWHGRAPRAERDSSGNCVEVSSATMRRNALRKEYLMSGTPPVTKHLIKRTPICESSPFKLPVPRHTVSIEMFSTAMTSAFAALRRYQSPWLDEIMRHFPADLPTDLGDFQSRVDIEELRRDLSRAWLEISQRPAEQLAREDQAAALREIAELGKMLRFRDVETGSLSYILEIQISGTLGDIQELRRRIEEALTSTAFHAALSTAKEYGYSISLLPNQKGEVLLVRGEETRYVNGYILRESA